VRLTQTSSRCKNLLEVLYHCAKFGAALRLRFPKNVEFFVCLSLNFPVRLLSDGDSAFNFTMKALEYRNDCDTVVQETVSMSMSIAIFSVAQIVKLLQSPRKRVL